MEGGREKRREEEEEVETEEDYVEVQDDADMEWEQVDPLQFEVPTSPKEPPQATKVSQEPLVPLPTLSVREDEFEVLTPANVVSDNVVSHENKSEEEPMWMEEIKKRDTTPYLSTSPGKAYASSTNGDAYAKNTSSSSPYTTNAPSTQPAYAFPSSAQVAYAMTQSIIVPLTKVNDDAPYCIAY